METADEMKEPVYKKENAASAAIEFFRPDGWKISTFFAIFFGFMIVTSTLSSYGLFSYVNCAATESAVLCKTENLFTIGLPAFYMGEKKIATKTVAAAFYPEMLVINIVVWYLLACGIVYATRAGGAEFVE